MEFMAEKSIGRLSGWITYTLSKTERKFSSVNDGNFFTLWLVRTHRITTVLNKQFGDKFDVSASWVFSSGIKENTEYSQLAPVIYRRGESMYPESTSPEISNSFTLIKGIPAYHRLDICLNFRKQKKNGVRTISAGLYNAYGRNNTLLISEHEGSLYLSYINMFIPFIQYSFKFR